jgi:hypothetical protein
MNYEDDKDIAARCRRCYRIAEDTEAEGRQERLDDIRFVRLRDQWPGYAAQGRNIPGRERPMLVVNRLMQFRNQVINEIRMASPNIRVRPVDDQADIEVAEVYEGIIRHISSISNADAAIDTAAEWQVDTGLGFIEVGTEYIEDTWDQEIIIQRCEDPFKWWIDPNSRSVDGSDMDWALYALDMPKDDFEQKYPQIDPQDFTYLDYSDFNGWLTKDTVRVGKYYWIEKEAVKEANPATGQKVTRFKRRCYVSIIAGDKEIERTEILFRGEAFIPVIPVYGLDTVIQGKRHLEGLIRNGKDPQRMLNFAKSASAEHVALVTKAPWVGTAEQFEGRPEWDDPNTPWAKMVYNPVSHMGTPLAAPNRANPPSPNNAWIQIEQQAIQDMQAALGIYDAALSANPNEQSGRALLSLQRQASQGTFHFSDNLGRSLKHLAKIIVGMVPMYYDAPRVARIIGEDGGQEYAQLDPTQPQAMMQATDQTGAIQKIYNLGVGRYDVVVDVGPSYATRRQESSEAAMQLVQSVPQIMGVAGDLIIKQMDWPLSQEISDRVKKSLPPNIVQDQEQQTPESQQAAQQMHTMASQMEHMSQVIQQLQDERQLKEAELHIKQFEAQTHRLAATKESPQAEPDHIANELAYVRQHADVDIAEQRLMLEKDKLDKDYQLRLLDLAMRYQGQQEAEEEVEETQGEQPDPLGTLSESMQTVMNALAESQGKVTETLAILAKPKKKSIVFSPEGRPVGIEDAE